MHVTEPRYTIPIRLKYTETFIENEGNIVKSVAIITDSLTSRTAASFVAINTFYRQ